MRQSAKRHCLGSLLGTLLSDRAPLPGVRRRSGLPLPVGGSVAHVGNVRLRRGSDLYRDPGRWIGIHVLWFWTAKPLNYTRDGGSAPGGPAVIIVRCSE